MKLLFNGCIVKSAIQIILNFIEFYFIGHFILFLFILFFFFTSFFSYLFLCIFSCVCVTYNCAVHGVDLTYISLLVIFCIIVYVTNKHLESLNHVWTEQELEQGVVLHVPKDRA